MSRKRRLQDRVKRGRWLMKRVVAMDMISLGFSAQLLDWRRPLRDGSMLPFWRGCPVVSSS